jgi:hypothetical protein
MILMVKKNVNMIYLSGCTNSLKCSEPSYIFLQNSMVLSSVLIMVMIVEFPQLVEGDAPGLYTY